MGGFLGVISVLFGKLAGDKTVVLFDQRFRTLFETCTIFIRPPVVELAVTVILAALIVETMTDLVADNRADTTIIGRIVSLGIEERRLQNRRREDNHVERGLIVGVHCLRVHQPFVTIHRLAGFGQLITVFIQGCGPHIIHKPGVIAHVKRRVIAPMIRVSDFRGELRQLLQRLGLGRFTQPVAGAD